MKIQKHNFTKSLYYLWAILLFWSFSACSDDDGISIYRVYTNMIGVPVTLAETVGASRNLRTLTRLLPSWT